VRSEDLDMSLVGLFFDLRTPEDIARATKLLDLVSADRRYNAEKGLAWARIASGMVEPAAGFRSVAKPGEFARHAVELLRNFDPGLDERARSIIKAAVETVEAFPEKQPFGDLFYPRALAEAQIKFGLLEDARKTIDAMEYAGNRPEQLLMLSTAQSRAGQVDAARATKAEGLALLTRVGTPSREANSRAAILLRAEMLDEAEAELRRLMVPNPKPNFSNVTKKLIEALVKRGETKRAFQLAVDWSALDGDPEAVASFYGALTNTESPAGNLWRTLRKHYSG
jgi:hypothetical protein